jgi:urocanate hydratase
MVKIDILSKLANKIIKELEEAIKKGEVKVDGKDLKVVDRHGNALAVLEKINEGV